MKRMKRVQVTFVTKSSSKKTLAYETDLPVKIGDKVLLPTPSWMRDVWGSTYEGTVTALKTDYDGQCTKIIRIIQEPQPQS